MNVEIGAEAAQFPEKEYINGIAVAVWVLPAAGLAAPRCSPYVMATSGALAASPTSSTPARSSLLASSVAAASLSAPLHCGQLAREPEP
jgi:hypothetical protein